MDYVIYVFKHFENDKNVLGSKATLRNMIAIHDHGHHKI